MPWFKVDDGFWSHPKVLDLPASAGWLWLRAGCYSSQHLTDGLIKTSALRMLGADVADAEALVSAGLWDGKTDGYEFHDWERYQPPSSTSKAKRDELSQKRAESGRKGADSRWHKASQTDGNSDGKLLSSSDGNAMAPSRPVPTRPEVSKDTSPAESGKRPSIRLPSDWVPTAAHYERAKTLGVNIVKEIDAFKGHAETHDRHAANWNAAFTTWLGKAKPSIARAPVRDWMNP